MFARCQELKMKHGCNYMRGVRFMKIVCQVTCDYCPQGEKPEITGEKGGEILIII